MSTGVQTSSAEAPAISGRRRSIALFIVLLGLLLDLLDIVIVNVALPSIQVGIGATPAHMQWMVAGYTLPFAVLLITSGRLGDIVGRKKMFLIGVAGFTIASALSGLAQNPEQLIAARILQGAMGAAMVPQVLSIIQIMYPPAERGKAFGMLSIVFATGTVGGPIIGALLTSLNVAGWSWRTIFLVNVPIGIAAFFIAWRLIPETKASGGRRLDVPATILVTIALLMLSFPLVQGRELGWPTWTFFSLGGSLVVFAILFVYQSRRTESPLIPMSLFRFKSFRGGLAVTIFFMGGVMPFFMINTLFLQQGRQYSVLEAGLTGIVWGFGVPLFTFISGRWITPKIGRLGLQVGLSLLVCAMLELIWAVRTFDNLSTLQLAPGLVIGGIGMGMTFAPLMTYTLNDVPGDEAGSASGIFNTAQQAGAAIGIAACGLVFFGLLASNAPDNAATMVTNLRAELATHQVADAPRDQLLADARGCFVERMRISDPVAVLPRCTAATAEAAAIGGLKLSTFEVRAVQVNYHQTMERALYYQIGLFLLALCASFLLPRRV